MPAVGLEDPDACGEDAGSVAFEYFRRGTGPEDFCTFHGGRSFFERLNLGSIACKLLGKGCRS